MPQNIHWSEITCPIKSLAFELHIYFSYDYLCCIFCFVKYYCCKLYVNHYFML